MRYTTTLYGWSDQSGLVSISSVPERKKRKSKWDQTTPPGGVRARETPSSQDASVSAAAAAARLNAMLEAQGKLNRQMVNSETFNMKQNHTVGVVTS